MSKYKFGYCENINEDFACVSVLNTETKELNSFYKAKEIYRQKDLRIAELEKQLSDLKTNAIVPKYYYGDFCNILEADENFVKCVITKKGSKAEEALREGK